MAYLLLIYDVDDDHLERRAEHLAVARMAAEHGELRLGGALAGPADGPVLVFEREDRRVAEAFAGLR